MSQKKDKSHIRLKRSHDINALFKLCKHKPKKLLDIGFGNCAIAEYYSSFGIEVSGVEVSKEIYERAIKKKLPKLKLHHYDGIHLPFDDFYFDTIILNDVLAHISYENIELLIPEILRVLKPDGLIYISVMNRWQLLEPHKLIPCLTWLPRIFWHPICKRITGADYINYWPYTRKRVKKLLNKFNLKYIDMSYIYVENKFLGKNPVGSRTTRKLLYFLLKLRLRRVAYILALKVTVLIYMVKIHDNG